MNAYEAKKGLKTFLLASLGVAALWVGLFVSRERLSLISKAFVAARPENVRVLFLSQTTATIFWRTPVKTRGYLKYGLTPSLENSAESRAEGLSHVVVLENLFPGKTYYFKIAAGNKLYGQGDVPYSFTTSGI